MGGLAVLVASIYDRRLLDPEGSFLGPSWLRLPLLLLGAVLLDLLPRTLWLSRFKPALMPDLVRERVRTHWTKDRMVLVAGGIVSFYVVYVSYRNLKSFLPSVISTKYDHELHLIDRAIFFGHEPGLVLQAVFGETVTAWVLSYIYLWFLPLVPLAVTAWLVWSRNLAFGYWFVCSQCIAWSLGTASYYALPTLGPGIAYPYVYTDLAHTPTTDLMRALVDGRHNVLWDGVAEAPGDALGRRGQRRAVDRGLRLAALRHHLPAGADGAVHRRQPGREMGRLGQLRSHRGRHPLLRLALRRRRRGRRDARPGLLLRRRPGGRTAVQAEGRGQEAGRPRARRRLLIRLVPVP
jgi:uncharacterized membrane protein (DUF485 family)